MSFGLNPINRNNPKITSRITIKIARANVYGIKKSMSKTVGPKYSSSLKEKPTGSFILTNPENINNEPTNTLNMFTKILSNSVFAVSKSGSVSLQISSSNIPSIIIYKLSFINFMIFKMLVNVKFANIINIINNREVIPELLQSECNADEIYRSVIYLLKNPDLIKKQLSDCSKTLEGIRSKTSSSEEACLVLRNYLS